MIKKFSNWRRIRTVRAAHAYRPLQKPPALSVVGAGYGEFVKPAGGS
jgi:hypothetical protein